ncbi:hypothetical protein [Trueperella pyogenes]
MADIARFDVAVGGLRELATVLDFAEKDESYGVFADVCVEVEPDRVRFVGTDRYILGTTELAGEFTGCERAAIPGDDMRRLLEALPKGVRGSKTPVRVEIDKDAGVWRVEAIGGARFEGGLSENTFPYTASLYPDYTGEVKSLRLDTARLAVVAKSAHKLAGKGGRVDMQFTGENRPARFLADSGTVKLDVIVMPVKSSGGESSATVGNSSSDNSEVESLRTECEALRAENTELRADRLEQAAVVRELLGEREQHTSGQEVVESDRPTKPVTVAVADPTPVTPTVSKWTAETVSKAVKGAGLTEKMVSRVVWALDDGKSVTDAVSWAIGCDHGRRFDRAVAGLSACVSKAA